MKHREDYYRLLGCVYEERGGDLCYSYIGCGQDGHWHCSQRFQTLGQVQDAIAVVRNEQAQEAYYRKLRECEDNQTKL